MRAGDIYRFPVQTSAFAADPLQQHRQRAKDALAHDYRPLGGTPQPIKSSSTPAYSRGSTTLYADEQLRISVELGPLLWFHTARGGTIGGLVDTFA